MEFGFLIHTKRQTYEHLVGKHLKDLDICESLNEHGGRSYTRVGTHVYVGILATLLDLEYYCSIARKSAVSVSKLTFESF